MVKVNLNGREVIQQDDQTSPFYLPHSDNPGVLLVTQQLTGQNYNNWHRSMITALLAKNKLAFVDGTLPEPPMGDLLHSQWIRCNSMVVSWIRNSVSPDISSSLMYINDAAQIWNDLRERFSQGNVARVYQLRQQLLSLNQGNMDVNSYYTSLRVLWDEFKDFQPSAWCECNGCRCNSARRWSEYQAQECAMQFLVGLNSSYASIRSHILSLSPMPSLSRIFAMVLQEERQRLIDTSSSSSLGNNASDLSGSIINAAGYNRGRGERDRFLCTKCGKTNHTVDRCFEIIGYPPGFGRGRGRGPSSGNYSNARFDGGNRVEHGYKSVNQFEDAASVSVGSDSAQPPASNPTLNPEHITHLISLLQTQIQQMQTPSSSSTPTANVVSHSGNSSGHTSGPSFSGSFSGDCDWEG